MSFIRQWRGGNDRTVPPPTQDHIPVREIRDNVIIRHDGTLVAVLGVEGLHLRLLDPAEQERLIAAYEGLITALPFGWQTLIIARPQDVAAHLAVLRQQAAAHDRAGSIHYHQLLLAYLDFFNQLAWDALALVRAYRIVVGYRHPSIEQLKERFGGRRVLTADLLREGLGELDHRVQQLQAGLQRVGLRTWVLSGPELKEELYRFYHPALQAEDIDLPPAPPVVRGA
ncbi:MAG: hypothetical protein KKB13_10910 [Chloroflexi bacterium]|nr:hypothetical protein [Chloroflexota bacterium]